MDLDNLTKLFSYLINFVISPYVVRSPSLILILSKLLPLNLYNATSFLKVLIVVCNSNSFKTDLLCCILKLGIHIIDWPVTTILMNQLLSNGHAGKPAFDQYLQPMAAELICVFWWVEESPLSEYNRTVGEIPASRPRVVVGICEFFFSLLSSWFNQKKVCIACLRSLSFKFAFKFKVFICCVGQYAIFTSLVCCVMSIDLIYGVIAIAMAPLSVLKGG